MPSPFLETHSQHPQLPIRLITPSFGGIAPEVLAGYGLTHRKPHYFLAFMLAGRMAHGVDLVRYELGPEELLFILPNQMHELPASKDGADYFKLNFDDTCLSRLPRQYPFLVDPLHHQKIAFDAAAAGRLRAVFAILQQLLGAPAAAPELILSYLNAILTEIDSAYFRGDKQAAGPRLAKYIEFRRFVEDHLTEHLPVATIATALGLSLTALYTIVTQFSGSSPKDYITDRLMLEARRRLCYGESSVKELAYDLGFNDPDYFSRLFRKRVGKSVSAFLDDLSGN